MHSAPPNILDNTGGSIIQSRDVNLAAKLPEALAAELAELTTGITARYATRIPTVRVQYAGMVITLFFLVF